MKRKEFIENYIEKNSIKNDWFGYDYNIKVDLENKDMSVAIDELQIKLNNIIEDIFNDKNKRLTKLEVIHLIGDNSLEKNPFENKIFLSINIMKIYDHLNERFEINKEKCKLYRIECEGQGIYSYLSNINKPLYKIFDFQSIGQIAPLEDEHLPAMCKAINYIDRSLIKYACESKEQLINWFPKKMIKYIVEHAPNTKIVEYEIEDSKVLTSKKQAAFISGTEIKTKEFSIEEWFNLENKKRLKNK